MLAWTFTLALVVFTHLSLASPVTPYTDPYAGNPYLATATSRLLKARNASPQTFTLAPLSGRDAVPTLEGRAATAMGYYAQAVPAPLAFVIPGAGGSAQDGQAIYLGEILFELGYSVVLLPSPFSWQFALGQSTEGLPGYSPADAEDLYRVMKQSVQALVQTGKIQPPTSYSVVGYSLGGVHAAFVRQLDRARQDFHFQRVVMINPPLSLRFATQTIDQMNAIGQAWDLQTRNARWGEAVALATEYLSRDINSPTYFLGLDQTWIRDPAVAQYLIGNSFRSSLAELVFASQQVQDVGLLHTPATSGRRNARLEEAKRVSFSDYLEKALYPFWRQRATGAPHLDALIAQGDLFRWEEELRRDTAVYLLHNQDDFLSQPSDLARLDRTLGNRSFLFPGGGHIGNFWNPQHRAVLQKIFAR